MTGRLDVRAAIAAATGTGDGRYPSSVPWCWDKIAATPPRVSAHATMSSMAAYDAARALGSAAADRIVNRMVNMPGSLLSRRLAVSTG